MIVKCDKCQTRFKIPDEKVTAKGVKVKCTKCQNTFRVAKAPSEAPPPPAAPPPPSVDPDPFAKFGVGKGPPPLEATTPGFFAAGVNASKPARSPLQPVLSAQTDVPSEVFDQPTRVAPVPQGLRTPAPSPAAAPAGFDPSNPFGSAPGFDPSHPFDASAAPPPAQATPPPRPETDFERTMPRSPVFDPFAAPPPGADGSEEPTAASEPTQTQATAPGLLDEVPEPSGLFGRPNATLTSQPLPSTFVDDGFGPPPDEPDRRLFDMPDTPGALGDPEDQVPTAAVARIQLKKVPTPAPSAEGEEDPGQMERPAGRPEDVGMSEARRPSAVGRGLGLVVNLAVGSLLVLGVLTVGTIYLNEGQVDPSRLSLEPVKALFAPPSPLRAVDVSNGLYETRSGKPIFYVRGSVENQGAEPATLQVRVDIMDGALSLTQAKALAGGSPTPEDLYRLGSARDLAALTQRLDEGALEVKPGGTAPFLVAFYDFPPELAQYRLKVTVERAEAPRKTAHR